MESERCANKKKGGRGEGGARTGREELVVDLLDPRLDRLRVGEEPAGERLELRLRIIVVVVLEGLLHLLRAGASENRGRRREREGRVDLALEAGDGAHPGCRVEERRDLLALLLVIILVVLLHNLGSGDDVGADVRAEDGELLLDLLGIGRLRGLVGAELLAKIVDRRRDERVDLRDLLLQIGEEVVGRLRVARHVLDDALELGVVDVLGLPAFAHEAGEALAELDHGFSRRKRAAVDEDEMPREELRPRLSDGLSG